MRSRRSQMEGGVKDGQSCGDSEQVVIMDGCETKRETGG